jgi:hypothetical protein
VGGDLERHAPLAGADGAERLPLSPRRVGPTLEQRQRLLRPGVGREVDVGTVMHAIEDHVAHDPPYEVGLVARSGEALGQRPDVVEDGLQPLGSHVARG